jgi:hypothetical protein
MRQKMDEPCRRPLLDIAPLAFGKWYYTALANETILSPANILSLDFQYDADNKTEYAYVMRTKPAEEQTDEEFISEYNFTLHAYSTEEHPIAEDLQTLISYCTPDRATDEHGLLLAEDQPALLEQLSMNSDFYLEYLTRLAWLHGLLIPMPSIHTQRVRPAAECESFFAQPTADILFQLAETACMLTAERFIYTMELEEGIATADFFYTLLRDHQEVDKIFVDFYKRVDVDIEKICYPDLGFYLHFHDRFRCFGTTGTLSGKRIHSLVRQRRKLTTPADRLSLFGAIAGGICFNITS